MFTGYFGLSVAFVLLMTLVLWVFIKADVNKWIKILLIPFTIWYSMALWFLPQYMLGHPSALEIPDKSIVLTYKIIEPTITDPGGMYFWVIDPNDYDISGLNPVEAFRIIDRTIPKAYKMKYDKELHKSIVKNKKTAGVLIWTKNKSAAGGIAGKFNQENGEFEVVNPGSIMRKEKI